MTQAFSFASPKRPFTVPSRPITETALSALHFAANVRRWWFAHRASAARIVHVARLVTGPMRA